MKWWNGRSCERRKNGWLVELVDKEKGRVMQEMPIDRTTAF